MQLLVMEIPMTGEDVAGTDMICGGNVDVLVQGASLLKRLKRVKSLKRFFKSSKKEGKASWTQGLCPTKIASASISFLV